MSNFRSISNHIPLEYIRMFKSSNQIRPTQVDVPIPVTYLEQTPKRYMWYGVAPRMKTRKTYICLKDIELHAHNMIIVLGSIVNILFSLGGGGYITI